MLSVLLVRRNVPIVRAVVIVQVAAQDAPLYKYKMLLLELGSGAIVVVVARRLQYVAIADITILQSPVGNVKLPSALPARGMA